jgi:hypothetical protein
MRIPQWRVRVFIAAVFGVLLLAALAPAPAAAAPAQDKPPPVPTLNWQP